MVKMGRMLLRQGLSFAVALPAVPALAPAAHAATAPPRLIGTPSVTYAISSNASSGRFVTIGGVVRLDRRFADTTEQHRYALVVGTRLHRGEVLPDELFGGTALGRFNRHPGAWYAAEAAQLRKHSSVRNGARWDVALARDGRIVGAIKHVTLRRR